MNYFEFKAFKINLILIIFAVGSSKKYLCLARFDVICQNEQAHF